MKYWNSLRWWVAVAASFFAGGFVATAQVDVAALSQETQRVAQGPNAMTMAWWMPEDFWAVTFAASPKAKAGEAEAALKAIRRYTVVAVLDGTPGASGAVSYRSGDELRQIMRLTDAWGNSYAPIAENEVDPAMKAMIQTMKPSLASTLGPLGQNLHFFLFPARNDAGDPIADARARGRFSVAVGKTELKWRLPVDALLPAKSCDECKQECKGSWKYCPWCGTKLAEK